jgi:ABC-type spermidine/putrescine transport system permease subunit II
MTPNWSGSLVNTLLIAFGACVFIGAALGVYAAKQLKKAEEKNK